MHINFMYMRSYKTYTSFKISVTTLCILQVIYESCVRLKGNLILINNNNHLGLTVLK